MLSYCPQRHKFEECYDQHPQFSVGNMMQSVVLDGNPLNEDEDMRLLTCVVLDGKPPDELILDLMDLVNDVNLI